MNIDTSLLREKFVIQEKNNSDEGHRTLQICCLSTRMPISLQAGGLPAEPYVVRAHNMHSCTRMVARMIQDYEKNGPLMSRTPPLDWEEIWHTAVLSSYERKYNANIWVSVYYKGKPVFSEGEYHPFLDVIEKCDALNHGDYEKSIQMAEDAFLQAGKEIDMICENNVALVAHLGKDSGRCSMVLRGANHATTFNYALKPKTDKEKLNITQCLSVAADFLEGVQLSHMIGFTSEKLGLGHIEKYSDEDRQMQEARKRVWQLNAQINTMENRSIVRYRPERPNFDLLIASTEKFARQCLSEPEEEAAEE